MFNGAGVIKRLLQKKLGLSQAVALSLQPHAVTDDILTDNGVRSQGSPDTMAIWNAKPGR